MSDDNINNYVPSLLNPRSTKKQRGLSLTQNSLLSHCSLSLKKANCDKFNKTEIRQKENIPNISNLTNKVQETKSDCHSIGLSVIDDLLTVNNPESSPFSFGGAAPIDETKVQDYDNKSVVLLGSSISGESTVILENYKPVVNISVGIAGCQTVDIGSKNSNLKRVLFTHDEGNVTLDCELVESSNLSTESELDENMNATPLTPQKRSAAAIDVEIKKKRLTEDATENKVLILKTNAIDKVTHVIVQPPNYKLVKRSLTNKVKFKRSLNSVKAYNGKAGDKLKQTAIDSYVKVCKVTDDTRSDVNSSQTKEDVDDMSRLLSGDTNRERSVRSHYKDVELKPRSARPPSLRKNDSSKDAVRTSSLDVRRSASPRNKAETSHPQSPKGTTEAIQFNLPKSKPAKVASPGKAIPYYKIVAGTHFAVDAFCYGEIPNVQHYFLTHFHSDHYSGLKKSFNKLLYCSKITADLCVSRLGVNAKYIQIMEIDSTIRIENTEVTAIDANHCPGAVMLVFSLPNGKSILHTGDFRASPVMESYPVFWNKDIHTIYLDTTYCSPRYDFPTQDQSLEMALCLLRQKKMALEKAGKKFSSVLIVCGTYTIGKEKFFLGVARRVGCGVWACPSKAAVLHAVRPRSTSTAPPAACQLHVVPMRDLTVEKLKSYLESLQGAFSEVVAFKPSGWENGKNSTVERDNITIHGIPYSEHSSFSEMIRFVKYLQPRQLIPTVDISGGVKAVQKYFPCPMMCRGDSTQGRLTDYFSIQPRGQTAVT